MLTEVQVDDVWKRMVKAEVRSLYFADLAADYAKKRRVITFFTFFTSSGAVATLVANYAAISGCMAFLAAVAMAYSLAIGLDKRAETLAKLHHQWNSLYAQYFRLWHHWNEEGAEQELDELISKAMEASDLAAVEAPRNDKLLESRTKEVFAQYDEHATV